jgi:glycosyltransferase involved in cell wall biosynthesis
MKKVSLIIACHNEIRFIRRTLESAIGEADEIILSDNASVDGTSDICQEYASKYPEIKYIRHKRNIGMGSNFLFSLTQAVGKYIRIMGGHDMISCGSSQSMLDLIEASQGTVMAFHKYTINLNPDYSFKSFHCFDEFKDDFLSESPFFRVKSMIRNICDFSMGFGLIKTDVVKHIFSQGGLFQYGISDHTQLAELAKFGKILIDDKSIFFRMNPHDKNESAFEQGARINKNLYPDKDYHPLFWTFAFIGEQYYLATEMQVMPDAPSGFSNEILNLLLNKYWWFNTELSLEMMPPVISGREDFCNNLIKSIKEFQNKKKSEENTSKIKYKNILKKIIKNLLPYYFVKLYRMSKLSEL